MAVRSERKPQENNVVALATKMKFVAMDRAMRAVFMRDGGKIMQVIWEMEDNNIIFMGELCQMTLEQIQAYTNDPKMTEIFIDGLKRFGLTTGMKVKNWPRPSTFGIRM